MIVVEWAWNPRTQEVGRGRSQDRCYLGSKVRPCVTEEGREQKGKREKDGVLKTGKAKLCLCHLGDRAR